MSVPTIFSFRSSEVRTLVINDEPWFVLSDVVGALGFSRSRDAARMLDDDEKGAHIVRTPGGDQEVIVINESGVYSLALRSRKPEAKPFRKWVTSEVLPAIRKTGQYVAQPYTRNPGDTLTVEQANTLRDLLTNSVKKLPKEKQASAMVKGWSKLKAHFKTDYRHIPQAEFAEALSIVARHVAECGELLDVAPTQAQIESAALAAITKPGVRFFATFHENKHGEQVINLQSIPEDAMVLPVSRLAEILSDPGMCLPTKFYTSLSRACMDVVERRAA